ncbi:alpha-ketoglutarate-dependent dioxygenase AlkB family protein [Cyanobium sp. ATX 6F1]|uniref:alpha-ketoglutarate-dependent dioxygenase AlkB family protein n=1 Tax=unclassified Cyanobium TaxID=2627006 RepID=UPI0020CF1401|nr:alpha-ketoglutarate-dependent dioxygenase AlkB [Cyanobium sp. ATX 6F1]
MVGLPQRPQRTCAEGLALRFWPGWLDGGPPGADRLLFQLLAEVPWRQEAISLFGRSHPLPRLTCWVADPGCHYTYSGLLNQPEPWSPPLEAVREQLGALLGCRFNSLLLNRYRHGGERMGWHADDEPELEASAPIASLSLGATRSFRLKPKRPERLAHAPISQELGHGDLLVMDPPTQRHWLHALPARLKIKEERINLTFRVVSG